MESNELADDRLYVVVDKTLSRGLQMAQAGHAIVELALDFPDPFKKWTNGGNILIVLEGDPRESGMDIARMWEGEAYDSWFAEPDLDGQITAWACFNKEGVQGVLKDLPLAGSKHRSWFSEWRRRRSENRRRTAARERMLHATRQG